MLLLSKNCDSGMHIAVTTDVHTQGHEELRQTVERDVTHVLSRFADQIMSLNVHLADVNGAQPGIADKHCSIDVRSRVVLLSLSVMMVQQLRVLLIGLSSSCSVYSQSASLKSKQLRAA